MVNYLTRVNFKQRVFDRDKCQCVICGASAVDAHHILERRLWIDGGYHLRNGASVCARCHWNCETTKISVGEIRKACGITKPLIPLRFYNDVEYDKWGNVILEDGTLLPGELFYDEGAQKALAAKLHLFKFYVKYPRTHHLPWSPGMHDDDRLIDSMKAFEGQEVIVTEKLDGENATLYYNHIHARSVTSSNHPSRDWVKNFWSKMKHDIPCGWRICGENLFAVHSIKYSNLPSYFMGFSMWDNHSRCLEWEDTLEWFGLLGITPVPTLYDGYYDEAIIRGLWDDRNASTTEGYVLRLKDAFPMSAFHKCVGKFVRKDHIQTVEHWMFGKEIERNSLCPEHLVDNYIGS